jgi:hypothetical protein
MRDFRLDKMRTPRASFSLSTLPPFLPILQSTKSTSIATMSLPQQHTQVIPDSYAKLLTDIPAANHHSSPGQTSGLGCIGLFHFIAIFAQIAALNSAQVSETQRVTGRYTYGSALISTQSLPCQSSGHTIFPVSRPSLGKKDDFMLL